jgi:hypothetical protein
MLMKKIRGSSQQVLHKSAKLTYHRGGLDRVFYRVCFGNNVDSIWTTPPQRIAR